MDVSGKNRQVKILLDVSSVNMPLTGIGRYAMELARHLPHQPQVAAMAYLSDNQVRARFDCDAPRQPSPPGKFRQLLKNVLPYDLVLGPYRSRKAKALARSLDPYSDYIFHSPNFSIPPVRGKSVVTLHDLSVFHFPHFHPRDRVNYIKDQVHYSVEHADLIIADSQFVRGELLDLFGLPTQRVVTLPLGVAPAYRPRPADDLRQLLSGYGLQPGQYLLSVGTIEPRKNLKGLLQAYGGLDKALRRRFPLVIAGAYGWNSAELMNEIGRLQGLGEVIYLDYVPEHDLPALYAGACVFCYFSFYEGFGLPVLEAMRSGVPVVGAASSALPELCGEVGLLVDPHDGSAIQAALHRSLVDSQWRSGAAQGGLERSGTYTWERTAAELVDALGVLAV